MRAMPEPETSAWIANAAAGPPAVKSDARRDRLRRRRGRRRRPLCGAFPASPLADPRFWRLCRQFHALGPRPLAEFLAELAGERMLRTRI